MKRRLLKLALFLLAGAVINVTIASVASIWFDVHPSRIIDSSWQPYQHYKLEYARGWPMRSMTSTCDRLTGSGAPGSTLNVQHGIEIPEQASASPAARRWLGPAVFHLIPLRPHPREFAINTLFYAAVLLLMLVVPSWLRRRHRIRHSLCPACAYPVGTSPTCTECGKPVSPSPFGRGVRGEGEARD